jgi:hypothetical protein
LQTQRFMNIRTLAPISGRNVIPPSLIRPGPFRRWLPADADTYLAKCEFETDLPNGYGPARVGFGSRSTFLFIKILTV